MQRIFVFGDCLTAPEIQNRLQDSYDVQRLQELCARAIHQLVRRRDYPFIAVDCGAFPDHLFENAATASKRCGDGSSWWFGNISRRCLPMDPMVADGRSGARFT